MTARRTVRTALATLAAGTATVLTTALGGIAPGAPAAHGATEEGAAQVDYVAMGDSYSAASGVLPPDPAAPPQCLRSIRNYPHVLAGRNADLALTDVTCGGADTNDYFEPQHQGVPPQLDALSADTDLVTMTIGGNDSSVFVNSIVRCGTLGASTLGRGNPCERKYGSQFTDTIRTKTYPALVRALSAVHQRAPEARVAILGYPWILPPTEGCFDKMSVARGDVPYLRNIQATLNDAVSRAAAETGTTYVDLSQVSEGHDACQPIGTRWVEPLLQSTNPVAVHPNALGEQRMADQTAAVLGLR